jgi:hypothetical protein
VPFFILLAMLMTAEPVRLKRWDLSIHLLTLPVLALAVTSTLILFAYRPMSEGLDKARAGLWPDAAKAITLSVRRDPNLAYYATEAGMAWAKAWEQSGDMFALVESRMMFARSGEIEPAPSLVWANLAVMEFNSGDTARAIDHITLAMDKAPREATYPLNRAWFLERSGDSEQAEKCYRETLELAPQWSSHPFWSQTPLRQQALVAWQAANPGLVLEGASYWQAARQALAAGKLAEASHTLAYAEWGGEDSLAVQVTYGQLAELQGAQKSAVEAYERVRATMDRRNLASQNFSQTYSRWLYHREGVDADLVPGYVQLGYDVGQFQALERLRLIYASQGKCGEAEKIWGSLQSAIRGGAVGTNKPAPACGSAALQSGGNPAW